MDFWLNVICTASRKSDIENKDPHYLCPQCYITFSDNQFTAGTVWLSPPVCAIPDLSCVVFRILSVSHQYHPPIRSISLPIGTPQSHPHLALFYFQPYLLTQA